MTQTIEISDGANSGTITITGLSENVDCVALVANPRVKMRIRSLLLFPGDDITEEKVVVRRGTVTGQIIGKLRSADGNYLVDKWEEIEEFNPVLAFADCTITSANTIILIRYTLSAI